MCGCMERLHLHGMVNGWTGRWTNEWIGARIIVNVSGVGLWVHANFTSSHYFGWVGWWVGGQMSG